MKIGLALSGGGVRAAAHIGVLKAFEENGIKVDMIGGTSAGSIVAALYAMGYTPKEMLYLFKKFAKEMIRVTPKYQKPDGKKVLSIHVGGILSGENISKIVDKIALEKNVYNMEDIKMPLVIVATDIDEGEKYVFTNFKKEEKYYIKGSKIGIATRASSSYPGVYAPCIYKGHKFVDGGVLDNIPTEEVRKLGADKVISVKFKLNKKGKVEGLANVSLKSVDMIFDKRAKDEVQKADILIDIHTNNVSIFNIKKIEECYNYGYEQTILQINQIREQINKNT